jgi:glucose-6-phosphate 1-dehydrogenase
MSQANKALFIIFGGTGDLAHRKLYPALYRLYSKGFLDEHFAVIGTARREWSDDYYQDVVKDSIDSIKESDEHATAFARHFRYQSHNVKHTEHYDTLKNLADELDQEYEIGGNRIFYLSMSPNFFGTITKHLKSQSLVTEDGFNRVIIEKPFGTDFDSSKDLNDEILEAFEEDQLYRIDHYLGKEMVQNILALRFSNPIIEGVWNKDFISNIQVTLSEELGVEDRGGYYDTSGALRDMIQNHILQVVSLLAMDAPESFDAANVRKQKVAILRSLKAITQENIEETFIRGQYEASSIDSSMVAYRAEDNVDEESMTETYVAGKIEVDTNRWENVPFYVRTGKRMAAKEARIDIVFKGSTLGLFDDKDAKENVLTIFMGPTEGFSWTINEKKIGPGMHTAPVELSHLRDKNTIDESPEAYEKLLLDALNGDETNFAHWEEVADSWKFVDSIRHAWEAAQTDLAFYESGTVGPKEADDLLQKNNHYWIWKG